MHRPLAIGLALVMATACSRERTQSAGKDPTPAPAITVKPLDAVPADTKIVLERSKCHGTCPAYALTIAADGRVHFEGRGYAYDPEPEKPHMVDAGDATIAPAKLLALVNRIRSAGYFEMEDDYPTKFTDGRRAKISVTLDGRTKNIADEVRYDADAGTVPPALRELEDEIDLVAGSKQFLDPKAK